MIKDRGTKKWTSIMLPELIEELRDALYEEEYRTDKPIIDEYQQAEFDSLVEYAMEYNYPVEFTTWHDGYVSVAIGRVHYVDVVGKNFRIKLLDEYESLDRVYMSDVIGVKVIEPD